MSEQKTDKRRTQKVHESLITAYMNIFGVSREDAIAALQARGLIPSNDTADEDAKVKSLMQKRGLSESAAIAILKANGGISKTFGSKKRKKKK